MDWDGSIDHLTHSASFPAWVAVGSAAFFGLVFLLSLVRAERTVANGALAALTFAGLTIAAVIGLRTTPEPADRVASVSFGNVPALACIDDMAGETALAACEKVLFSAPDTVAAAVAYTATRINRLVALGNSGQTDRVLSADQLALRNAIEKDRYGLVAYVLTTRDKCQPTQCAAFAAMTDHRQIASNMDALIYEGLVARYAAAWSAHDPIAPAALSEPAVLSGKPSSIDFPTAASIPPVSIMNPEPTGSRAAPATSETSTAAPPAATGGPYVPVAPNAARKRAPAKRAPAATEVAPEAAPQQLLPPYMPQQ